MDHGADFTASAAALDGLTTAAQSRASLLPSSLIYANENTDGDPPIEHIHAVSDHPKTHSWLSKIVSEKTLRDVESRWKLGTRCVLLTLS